MRNSSSIWKLEKGRNILPWSLQEEHSPVEDTLILAPKTHFGLLISGTMR